MPLLDTKTVNVAMVLAAEARGIISKIEYWNPITNTLQDTPPTDVPFGQPVGCRAYMKNTGTLTQRMYLILRLKRPDGTIKSVLDMSALPTYLAPNAEAHSSWVDAADMAGTWQMVIELYGEVV